MVIDTSHISIGEDSLDDLDKVYYKNKNLKLLVDLLAESSGIAPAVRILSLFDKKFRKRLIVESLRVQRKSADKLVVNFTEPETIADVFGDIEDVNFAFVAELSPPPTENSVATFRHDRKSGLINPRQIKVRANDKMLDDEVESVLYRVEFADLTADRDYRVKISTLLNGKTIASKTVKC